MYLCASVALLKAKIRHYRKMVVCQFEFLRFKRFLVLLK